MLVTIDTDQLVRDAATRVMDGEFETESQCILLALEKQMPDEFRLRMQVRRQVKEYKKLTMWR
jgi:hypothetical protein